MVQATPDVQFNSLRLWNYHHAAVGRAQRCFSCWLPDLSVRHIAVVLCWARLHKHCTLRQRKQSLLVPAASLSVCSPDELHPNLSPHYTSLFGYQIVSFKLGTQEAARARCVLRLSFFISVVGGATKLSEQKKMEAVQCNWIPPERRLLLLMFLLLLVIRICYCPISNLSNAACSQGEGGQGHSGLVRSFTWDTQTQHGSKGVGWLAFTVYVPSLKKMRWKCLLWAFFPNYLEAPLFVHHILFNYSCSCKMRRLQISSQWQ